MDLWNFREPFSAWSHALWLFLSLPATLILWQKSQGDRAKRLSLLVFGMSLAACYLGSAVYHGVRVDQGRIDLFERLDHVGILLLIAGSYTPIACTLLRGRARLATLALVWGTTAISSTLLLINIRLPGPLATCEYLALGWGALFCYVDIARRTSHRALRALVLGGVFYSVGALLNLMHWPEFWPGVIGHHEIFHLWVMAGSFAHFWFMLTVVVPFAAVVGTEAESSAWVESRSNGPLRPLPDAIALRLSRQRWVPQPVFLDEPPPRHDERPGR